MADLKTFAEQLVNLSVKEVSELADILKNEYGIELSLIHISEPTRLGMISYAVFCLKKQWMIPKKILVN